MADFYNIEVAASVEPITFDEASKWCRDILSADADIVNLLIRAATISVEKATNRIFIERTIKGFFDTLCTSQYEPHEYIEIRRAPIQTITSISVNGTILDSSEYVLKQDSGFSRILFPNFSTSLDTDLAYPIEVIFTAGYGDATKIPGDLKTAIQQTVLFWYENRGDVSADEKQNFPFITKRIIKQNKILNTFG